MSTIRGYDVQNISADTGEVVVFPAPLIGGTPPPPGTGEELLRLGLRNSVHTPEDPYVGGQYLVTLRYHDGKSLREENVAIQTFATDPLDPATYNYNETQFNIWWDHSRDLTIQVTPLVPGPGTVNVLLDYVSP
jgi:hypothetical protein